MSSFRARRGDGANVAPGRGFALYVEGPRDRDILEGWARRVSAQLPRELARVSVILGGCRPARAVAHLREARRRDAAASGLCVLDRDGRTSPVPAPDDEPGLEFFVWGRRHIESYLLVPDAIQRSLRLPAEDTRVRRFFRAHLPDARDEEGLRDVDAKRLFGARGPLARTLGRPVPPGRVARAMRPGELHTEVVDLMARLQRALGLAEPHTTIRRG